MKIGPILERVIIGLFLGVAASGLVLSPHSGLYPTTFGIVEAVVTVFLCAMSTLFAFSIDSDLD